METIQRIVTPVRADTILRDIQKWHEEYIKFHNIECEELQRKILQVKLENVSFNLKHNPKLMGNLATLLPHEMNPKKWEEIMQLQQAQQQKTNDVVETDMFQCGRCNSKKCTYFTLQTRGGDEGETQYITCLNCSKRWKQ
jgi:DNA-directed RNA polymerase subunit M/transcription elongation factor TFIIS